MAKNFWKEKWRKRAVLGTAAVLSLSLALGTLCACKSTPDDDDDEDNTTVSRTDTQLIKNGDFEFYSEMDKEQDDKRAFINSPNNWSFTSGSPSSTTASGLINVSKDEWNSYTQSTYPLVSADLLEMDKKSDMTDSQKNAEKDSAAPAAISGAIANWTQASVYDRLQFLDFFDDQIDDLSSSSTEKKFFNDYNYSIKFEDVEKLREEIGDSADLPAKGEFKTHNGKEDNNGVLMIHNTRTSDSVRGTGQYYTSSSTVTLKPGTAAKVSVWVKTSHLYHFYDNDGEGTPVTRKSAKGGAYIAVTNTVGSSTLDQMRIENIRSPYPDEDLSASNNGWIQYTLFVRGSTFADSTFRIVLGLGQSTSSNRYEAVDGYALFDDLECTIMSSADYETESETAGIQPNSTAYRCTINSKKEEKIFDAKSENGQPNLPAYALDLYAGFDPVTYITGEAKTALTEEYSGSHKHTSLIEEDENDLTGLFTYGDLLNRTNAGNANYNRYLAAFFEEDFKDNFPFNEAGANDEQVVMLLSTKGAAYTSTVTNASFFVPKDKYKLVSFFVKTSKIRAGSGASATLVDEGGNETTISAFDSTTLTKTDIDNNQADSPFNKKDIYNGWTQCFFFVENSTDKDQTFTLKLRFGTTAVATATSSDYDDGWAAFTKFETHSLTTAQYGYVSTNSRAVKVSLTDDAKDTSSFDSASRTSDIKKGLANPVNFTGIVSTNNRIDTSETGKEENELPAGVYAGLLNAEHAETYRTLSESPWSAQLTTIAKDTSLEGQAWWNAIFSDASLSGRVSNQPLVILNTNNAEADSYGYLANDTTTVSADSYRKISMRVKLSEGATAYIYLNDASDVKKGFSSPLTPSMTKVTYWYDDEGNICRKDPSDKDFKSKTDVLYYLETNGLYTKAGDTEHKVYYANLSNYDKDAYGNLVTGDDGTIAYYCHEDTFYAYYDKKKDVYSQPVQPLPTVDDDGNSILRHSAPDDLSSYNSVIKVTGTEKTAGKWIDVSFFIHTGNEEKTFRLEIWAGDRNKGKMPAGSYFFFDSYSSTDASSNYSTLLAEKTENMKRYYNKTNNLTPDKDGYLGADSFFPDDSNFALYSTFTFYDAPWYLRYDETTDEDNAGNPYAGYTQSSYNKTLIYFAYDNVNGTINADELPSTNCFLDYSAYNVTVEKSADTDDDHDHDHDDANNNNGDSNIWLILSSVLLVVALVFAAGVVIGRRVVQHLKKTGRISSTKAPKKKKKAPAPVVKEVKEEPVDEPEDTKEEEDPNSPYNE